MSEPGDAAAISEEYYDSSPAIAFYKNVWGGEDIHIGIYRTESEDIAEASRRTVATMGDRLTALRGGGARIIDLGAGFGGSARNLASRYDCHVTCLNLSEAQNAVNREMTEAAGLQDRIDVVYGSFEDIPFPDESFDVVWSQDAILHSAHRRRVLDEAARVLRPGGEFIFTDPMQSEACPAEVLEPILGRIHLESLSSFEFYSAELKQRHFEELGIIPMRGELFRHFSRINDELTRKYDEICEMSGDEYVDNMLEGLKHWVDGAEKGFLDWGILHFRKSDEALRSA